MPLTPAACFRALVVAAITLHVFWMYALARTMNEGVGFRPAVAIVSAMFALAMLFPLVWAIALLELPDLLQSFRSARWFRAGRCPGCGYPAETLEGGQCPECSAPVGEPIPYRFTPHAVRRFAIAVAVAWVIGTVCGELWLLRDERRFEQEAAQIDSWERPRCWPVGWSTLPARER